jgi:hypothetical protein
MPTGRPPLRALARAAAAAVAVLLALAGAGGPDRAPALARAAAADEEWLAEFEAICARTQDAMTLATDELRALVARCDRLRPKVDALDPTRRKVYQRRLQQCRDLYRFVLDSREG